MDREGHDGGDGGDGPLGIRGAGAVRVLVLRNPGKRNAIAPGLHEAMRRALDAARDDPAVGALVLTGADGYFCSGGDLGVLATRHALPPAERRARIENLHGMVRALRDCPKPVVAAVEGGAAGAGMSLALACDLLVAARDARFSVAYARVGLTPDGGITGFLAAALPRQLLAEWCLTGDPIGAERLHALGIANRLAAPGAVEVEALAIAARLAAGPQRALGRIKALCHAAHGSGLDAQLDREADAMAESQADAEAAEGMAAFRERRAPDFAALRAGPAG
ncbi:MAG: enoyl-CoA hydratase family protein [Xylophilus ampelinus]